MASCRNCGQEIRPEARFCNYCGQPINELPNNQPALQPVGESDDIPLQAAEQPSQADEEIAPLTNNESQPYTGKTIPLDSIEASAQDDSRMNPAVINPTVTKEVGLQPDEELPFEMLPVGSVINGRYRLLSSEWEGETLLYQVEDLRRCWNCQAVQEEPDAAFCETCGAELAQKPRLLLRASRPGLEAPALDVSENGFLENGTFYQVESQPLQAAPEPQATQLMLSVGYRTDAGKQRDNNEDSLLVLHMAALCEIKSSPALGFFAVADGVGGYTAGEVASQAVVRSLAKNILEQVFIPEINDQPLGIDDLAERLRLAVLAANQEVNQVRQSSTNDAQMESTLTAALVRQTSAVIANVGDSRTYLMRQGHISPLTKDHSVVARLVERGVIQPAEVYTHEQRNIIYRTLGESGELEVDLYPLELQPGDRLLLCSDGLWEMVRDPLMEDVLLERFDPQQACDKLLELANMAGGEDNISVIVANLQA